MRIGVIDYGMGNLKSVANALDMIGCDHAVISDPGACAAYDKLILPGVGAFSEAVANLRSSGLGAALQDYVAHGRPVLGICLGMQLLCTESHEDGLWPGLGWIDARVVRFPDLPGIKVPHMGWNALEPARPDPLLEGINAGADVYFVHSYYVDCANPADVLAYAEHGVRFAAVVRRGQVCGAQFHPEKSQQSGIRLLRNFVAG